MGGELVADGGELGRHRDMVCGSGADCVLARLNGITNRHCSERTVQGWKQ